MPSSWYQLLPKQQTGRKQNKSLKHRRTLRRIQQRLQYPKQIRKQQELTALSAVYPKKEGFDVSCSILSKEVRMMDLMIHVSTKEQADAICANWNERHLDAYTSLIELLAE